MMLNGTRRMAAKIGTQVSTTMRPTRLPRYIEAISPQTNSFCSTNSIGPGCRPQISRPPRRTAAVGEPGTPSESIGNNAEVPAACAAVSGAITPSISLGVPGSPTAAVLLGGLLIWGLQPGPMLFVEQKEFVWGLIASMYLGNLV